MNENENHNEGKGYSYGDYLQSGEVKDPFTVNPEPDPSNEYTSGYTNEGIRNSLGNPESSAPTPSERNDESANSSQNNDDGYDYYNGYGY